MATVYSLSTLAIQWQIGNECNFKCDYCHTDYHDGSNPYISFELFVRPMIRTMLGAATIHRPSVKAKLEKAIESSAGMRSYIRASLSENGKSILPLDHQEEISSLSDANAFIAVGEKELHLKAGDEVTVVVLERRYI